MPYTMDDFRRDFICKHLRELKPEEVLAQFSPEEVLARYSPEEVLARYSPEERLAGLRPEERLTGLGPEDIEAYLRRARGELGTPRKREKKSEGSPVSSEGLTMPYTMDDFRRDFIRKHLRELKPEELEARCLRSRTVTSGKNQNRPCK